MRTDLDKEILDQTNGFLFFGVPNLGMSIGSLVPMVGEKPNRALIETLGNNSALLRDHMAGFPSVFGFNKPEVVAFYETQLSRTTCKVSIEVQLRKPRLTRSVGRGKVENGGPGSPAGGLCLCYKWPQPLSSDRS